MQFLGLEKQRTVTVIADRYSEVAALSPRTFLPGSTIHNRLTAYAEMRMEIEAKIAVVRKRLFCAHLVLKPSICPDRLGTNIGKLVGEQDVFRRVRKWTSTACRSILRNGMRRWSRVRRCWSLRRTTLGEM